MADKDGPLGEFDDPSEAARTLGKLGASKGGKARAEALSPERRSEIAKKAVQSRWAKAKSGEYIPRATHGSQDHPLRIGNIEIPCYVLEDGRRVLIQRSLIDALGMAQGTASGIGEGDRLGRFIAGKSINPFINNDLANLIIEPILFSTPTGVIAYGYEATVLADICDAVLAARKAGALRKSQQHIAAQCEILVRGFARVGIIALVDEATGYQADRERTELRRILEAYITKELLPWTERFPREFYQELFRLNGWQFDPLSVKRPKMIGKLTVELVYDKLPPGVLEELRARNPVAYRGGTRKHRHHQLLTQDIGNPHLEKQVASVTTLMRASNTWSMFKRLFDKAFPRRERQREMFHEPESDTESSQADSDT